jgi:hypothetical protein
VAGDAASDHVSVAFGLFIAATVVFAAHIVDLLLSQILCSLFRADAGHESEDRRVKVIVFNHSLHFEPRRRIGAQLSSKDVEDVF